MAQHSIQVFPRPSFSHDLAFTEHVLDKIERQEQSSEEIRLRLSGNCPCRVIYLDLPKLKVYPCKHSAVTKSLPFYLQFSTLKYV